MRYYHAKQERWQKNEGFWPKAPHGGWTETLAKGGFLAMLALVLVLRFASGEAKPLPTLQGDASAQRRADALAQAFWAKGAAWSDADLVTVRNGLVAIINGDEPHGEATVRYVRSRIEATVGVALDQIREQVSSAQDVKERVAAERRHMRVRHALDSNPPPPIFAEGEAGNLLSVMFRKIIKVYLLFMPIAFVCFYSRIVRLRMSFANELVFGWYRLLKSVIFWPIGLAAYPSNSALSIRRAKIAIDYMARMGLAWKDLTPIHEAAIDRLAEAPRTELKNSLRALRELPWHILLKARFSLAMSLLIGLVWSLLSFGRGTAMAAEPAASEVATSVARPEARPPMKFAGYAQFASDPSEADMRTERLIVKVDASPIEGLAVNLMANAATPSVYRAEGSVRRGSIGLRAGQIVLHSAFQVPAPDGQRLIGGPASQDLIQFWRLGAEVFGSHGRFGWALAYLPGPDLSRPDAQNPKEAQAAIQFSDIGPLGVMAAFQGGNHPSGIHLRSSAQISLGLGPVDVVANGAFSRSEGGSSKGVSSFIGWRCTPHIDLAMGHDYLAPANGQKENRIRLQTTLLGFKDLFRVGVMGLWSSVTGFDARVRIQFAF